MTNREKMLLRLAAKNREQRPSSWESIREAKIVEKIRRKYTYSQELSCLRARDEKPEKFAEYNSYVKICIAEADAELAGDIGNG